MEALVTKKLKRWASEMNIIPLEQSGFQPSRMTLDVHANIFQRAMDSLRERKRTIITIDLKAAFDRVWRGGLLRDLAGYGLHPKALKWLRSFLTDRRGKVRWDDTEGRYMDLKEGVPRGSPISPLLCCLATAKLPKVVKEAAPNCQVDQFADDLTICTTERTVKAASSQLEPALKAVETWAEENEMKTAGEKR